MSEIFRQNQNEAVFLPFFLCQYLLFFPSVAEILVDGRSFPKLFLFRDSCLIVTLVGG